MTSYNNTKDLTDFSWRDELWLQYNPLDEVTVLRDYFALSPFYDPECNNEVAKMRNLDISMLPILPPGVEYVVQSSQEPHLYIIRKQYRYNPTTTTTQAFYYVHTGTVYQAPSLHAAILSRWKRCLFCVTKAFRRIRSDLDPLGEWKSVGGREGSWPGKVPEVKRALAKDQQEKLLEGSRLISGALAKFTTPEGLPLPRAPAAVAPGTGTPPASSQMPTASPPNATGTPGEPSLATTDSLKQNATGRTDGDEREVTKRQRTA